MTLDRSAQQFLDRVRDGDESATKELLDCYVERLIELARSRLSPKLTRRLDPEDVVQSAFRSFFRQARTGRDDVREEEDLWRLLAAITLHKVLRRAKYHRAKKRNVSSEESGVLWSALRAVGHEAYAREPTPEEAITLKEQVEEVMRRLSKLQRRVIELRLQGNSVEEISIEARCSERSVHRAVGLASKHLTELLAAQVQS